MLAHLATQAAIATRAADLVCLRVAMLDAHRASVIAACTAVCMHKWPWQACRGNWGTWHACISHPAGLLMTAPATPL
eukprot:354987-Chlamydomonas_euryale.AAC.12